MRFRFALLCTPLFVLLFLVAFDIGQPSTPTPASPNEDDLQAAMAALQPRVAQHAYWHGGVFVVAP